MKSTRVKRTVGAVEWRAVASGLAMLALVLLVGAVIVAAVPAAIGMDESYVVRSASMSPSIGAGAVVFVSDAPAEALHAGDVITFERTGTDSIVTHRIENVLERHGEIRFVTKGDANEEVDPEPVGSDELVGKVAFSIPLLGYLLTFAQSRTGVLLLIVVPAVLLVASELWVLYRASRTTRRGAEQQ